MRKNHRQKGGKGGKFEGKREKISEAKGLGEERARRQEGGRSRGIIRSSIATANHRPPISSSASSPSNNNFPSNLGADSTKTLAEAGQNYLRPDAPRPPTASTLTLFSHHLLSS